MLLEVALFASAVSTGSATAAQPPAPAVQTDASETGSSAPAPVSQAPVKQKRICKYEEVTGSRTAAKKLCLTAEQWKKRQD